jgi:tRNA nucleotidyltransferase (CCA-adding enzyme)
LAKTVNEKTGNDSFHGHAEAGAELAQKIMRRLKFDNETISKVSRLVRHHDYDLDHKLKFNYPDLEHDFILNNIEISDKYVRRAINRIGEDIYPLFLKVQAADVAAQSEYLRAEKNAYHEELIRIYEKIKAAGDPGTLKDLALTGHDLITAGIPPGKRIGRTLNALLEDVIDHPEHNSREYLLDKAMSIV